MNWIKLKIGDKFYCKKTLIYYREQCFTQGEYYIINDIINPVTISIKDEVGDSFYFSLYTSEHDLFVSQMLGDYFYTEQEIRKLKLNKLNKT